MENDAIKGNNNNNVIINDSSKSLNDSSLEGVVAPSTLNSNDVETKITTPKQNLNEIKQRGISIDSNSASGTRTRTRTSSAILRERGNSLMGNELVKESSAIENEDAIIDNDQSLSNDIVNDDSINIEESTSTPLPEIIKPKFFQDAPPPPVLPAVAQNSAQKSSLAAPPSYASVVASSPKPMAPKKPIEQPKTQLATQQQKPPSPVEPKAKVESAPLTSTVVKESASKEKDSNKEEAKPTESSLTTAKPTEGAKDAQGTPKPKPKSDPMMRIFKLLWPFPWGLSKKR